jgi:hypothetical protein
MEGQVKMARKTGKLAPWQKKALEVYGGGDYAYMTTIEEVRKAHKDTFLDGLGYFILIELDPGEDCDSLEEASRRIISAMDDLENVRDALEDLAVEVDPDPDYDSDGNLKAGVDHAG